MKQYSSTMDKEIVSVTISKSVVLFSSIAVLFVLVFKDGTSSFWEATAIGGAALMIISYYLFLFSSSPEGYLLTDDTLVIKRLLGNITISLNSIETISIINTSDYLPTTYTGLKNTGLFGYNGCLVINNIKTLLYVKRKRDNILITLSDKRNIIISPDDISIIIDIEEAIKLMKYNA